MTPVNPAVLISPARPNVTAMDSGPSWLVFCLVTELVLAEIERRRAQSATVVVAYFSRRQVGSWVRRSGIMELLKIISGRLQLVSVHGARPLMICALVVVMWGSPAGVSYAQSGDAVPEAGAAVSGTGQPAGEIPAQEGPSAVPTSPQEIVHAIGYSFSAIFAIASVIALWSAIERLVLLRKRRVIPRAFVDRFLMHLRTGRMDKTNAIAVCQQNSSPVAEIFLHGVRKWGKPSVEIEQAVMDGGERQVALLKKRLRVLNGVATLMPLIGLLGTVIGMIQAFNDIANSNAMGQAQELAQGIAVALLTTAIGLFIAIPALAAYMYLAGRIDALVVAMDRLGQDVVHLISAEALRERGEQPAVAAGKRPVKKKPAAE